MDDLTDEQLGTLAASLRGLQGDLRSSLKPLNDAAKTVDLDEPIGRLTRVDALQQQSMAKANRAAARVRLRLVEAALKRCEEGTYGDCLECGEPIGPARLGVRPEAFLCIDCQEERERA